MQYLAETIYGTWIIFILFLCMIWPFKVIHYRYHTRDLGTKLDNFMLLISVLVFVSSIIWILRIVIVGAISLIELLR